MDKEKFEELLKKKITENLVFIEKELISDLKAELRKSSSTNRLLELEITRLSQEILDFSHRFAPKSSQTPQKNKRTNSYSKSTIETSVSVDNSENVQQEKIENLNKIIKKCQVMLNEKVNEISTMEKEFYGQINILEKELVKERFEKDMLLKKENQGSKERFAAENFEYINKQLEEQIYELSQENAAITDEVMKLDKEKQELIDLLSTKNGESKAEKDNLSKYLAEREANIDNLKSIMHENEENYLIQIEKIKLENLLQIRQLEDSLDKMKNEKSLLEEDCKGYKSQLKAYEQSLNDLKKHIGSIDVKIVEKNQESSSLRQELDVEKSKNENLEDELGKKSQDLETLKQIFDKTRQELSNKLQEATKNIENYKKMCKTLEDEVQNQTEKASTLEKSFKQLTLAHKKSKTHKKALQSQIITLKDEINNLTPKLITYSETLKSCENMIKTEYSSMCSNHKIQQKTFDTLQGCISEIFKIFPKKYEEEIHSLANQLEKITKETESLQQMDINKSHQLAALQEHEEYLMSQISYLGDINNEQANEISYAKEYLSKLLKDTIISLPESFPKVLANFDSLFKENKQLIQIIEEHEDTIAHLSEQREKILKENGKIQNEMTGLVKELENCRDLESQKIGNLHENYFAESQNMRSMLLEYRKNKQDMEDKVKNLQKSLKEAYRVRDILADELSQKCDIIEGFTKSSSFHMKY